MNAPIARIPGTLRKRARARVRAMRMPLMPSLQRRRLQCQIAFMLGDMAAIFVGYLLAGLLQGQALNGSATVLPQLILPVYLTIALYNDAYSHDSLRSVSHSVSCAVMALGLSAAAVTFITFYARSSGDYSRMIFTAGVVIAALLVTINRLAMRRIVRWRCGSNVINQLVIDDGGPALTLPGAFHVSAKSFLLNPTLDDPHALDRIGMVIRNADRVIISSVPERRADWSIILRGANVAGEVVDNTVLELSAQGARIVGRHGLLQVSVGPMGLRDRVQKRLLDAAVAGTALLLLSPLLMLVALAIKLEDGGSIFFVQRRVGRGNRFFAIFKFRSMSENRIGLDGSRSASRNDQRITRVGRFIRSTSLDELPQLFNVLRGDMSLVGPRPHATGSLAGEKLFWEVDPRYWERHALKPGLTGLAQIRGYRGATDSEDDLTQRLYADLEYLQGWSLWRDIWIMLMTVRVLIHERAF